MGASANFQVAFRHSPTVGGCLKTATQQADASILGRKFLFYPLEKNKINLYNINVSSD